METRIKGRLSTDTYQQYEAFCEAHQLSGHGRDNQAVTLLLNPAPADTTDTPLTLASLLEQIGCTFEETVLVAGVLYQQDFAWEKFVHDAVMSMADRWAKRQERLADVAESEVGARRKVKGTAYAEVANAVEHLIRDNEQAPAKEHRRYLSKPLVQRESGCSTIIVRKYFEDHGARIDAHNQAMGFADYETGRHHNQWIYRPYQNNHGEMGHEENGGTVEENPVVA